MPRRTVKRTFEPTATFFIASKTFSGRVHRRAVDGRDHIVRLELADRRLTRLDRVDERSGRLQHDSLAGGAQGDRCGDLLRAVHVLQVDPLALLLVDAGRVHRIGGIEVCALVQPAEEPFQDRRLPDDHVDEVDAALRRVVAAAEGDQWRDRVCAVGQEDVLVGADDARRHDHERQHERGESEPDHEQAGRGEEAFHRSERAAPPSTWTVVPVMYEARSEARKQTTSPNSCARPRRRSGICSSCSGGGPSLP